MKVEMVMPQMGESIAEATIVRWVKGVGDRVERDETILEISTDKVDSEIPAPESGVIVELRAKEGETVEVKSIIAIIDTEGSAAATPAPAKKEAAPAKAAPAPVATPAAAPAPSSAADDRFYSPLVRSLAAQHGVSEAELANIPGTGANSRVSKTDFMAYVSNRGAAPAAAPVAAKAAPAPAARPQFDSSGVKVEKLDNMRKKIAEHMVMSKHTSPHVYSMIEVDMTNIAKWRAAQQKAFVAREGFKISFTPFFLEAASRGLAQFPKINASLNGDELILKRDINIGCAVALGTSGLIVPVIKGTDQLSLTGIARGLDDLATRARDKQLKPDEVSGGTFTLTNAGVFGSTFGCPIINQPQLAILSVGAIKKRPVVVNDDQIAIRDIVCLVLAYDHRVIDGALGGQFLSFVQKYLEGWDMNRQG